MSFDREKLKNVALITAKRLMKKRPNMKCLCGSNKKAKRCCGRPDA